MQYIDQTILVLLVILYFKRQVAGVYNTVSLVLQIIIIATLLCIILCL
jgi:hypothetical protein